MIKRILRILLPIAIIGIALLGYGMLQSKPPEAPPEVPQARQWLVDAQTVRKSALIPTARLLGRVVTPSKSVLSSILEAKVIEVRVLPGQSVRKGDVLVELDSQNIETQVKQFKADVARIKASIVREDQRLESDTEILFHEERLRELASESLERFQTLKSRNVISQADFDAAEQAEQQARLAVTARRAAIREYSSRVLVLEAELQRGQAALDKVLLELEETVIRAPYDGRITAIHVATGSRVRNGSLLLDMYDHTQTEIRTLIPNRYIEQVRKTIEHQGAIEAVADLDGRKLELILNRLGTEIDPGRGGIDAYFHMVSGSIHPELGRSISLNMSLSPIDDAIALPFQAVYGSNHVFKIVSDRLRRIEIERVGQFAIDQKTYIVAISNHLSDGDLILASQLVNATEGLAVIVSKTQ